MVQNKIFNKHFGSSACAAHAGALFKAIYIGRPHYTKQTK